MAVDIEPAALEREDAARFCALSTTAMEGLVQAGKFPRPRQLSPRRVGWLVSELRKWLDELPVSDLPPPKNTGAKKGQRDGAGLAASSSR